MVFSRDLLLLPPDGKVETNGRGRTKVSTGDRLQLEQQHLQLAMSTMKVTFQPVLDYTADPLYLEEIFPLVFNECRTKRQLLEGLQNLLTYCPDTDAVNRNKPILLEWLKDPATILQRAHSVPKPFDSLEEYYQDITNSLPKFFPQSNRNHRLRKIPQERLVTRREVLLRLRQMDAARTITANTMNMQVNNNRVNNKRSSFPIEDSDDTVMGHVVGRHEEEVSVGTGENKRLRRTSYHGNIVDELAVQPSLVDDRYQPLRNGDHPPNRENSTFEIEYDSLLRWEEQPVVATDEQMQSVTARLVVEGPEFDLQLYHGPIELYVAWDLHKYYHWFEVLEKQQSLDQLLRKERSTLIIPTCGGAGLHTCKPLLVVARPGCAIFEDYFPAPSFFELDLTMLVKFIFKHGKSDQIRSAPGGSNILKVLGSRFDFGNAGQARDLTVQEFRPLDLCGCEVLKDPQNSPVRLCIGRILDAMWQCSETLSEKVVGRYSQLTSSTRFLEYASNLQNFLGATEFRTEWVTLQLLNLSHLQGGYRHNDVSNDPREGFNHSIVFCLHFTDAVGDLWSFKVITCFRKRVGDYLGGPYSKLHALKEALVQQLRHIDQQYQFLIGQRSKGLAPSTFPTWQDYTLFWLDDLMPYTRHLLEAYGMPAGLKPPPPVSVKVLRLTASSTRCYWMSTALSGIFGYSPWLDARGMIQLGLLAVCQPSFCHFYVVTKEMKEAATSDAKDTNPIENYYQTFLHLFGGTFERISLPTVKADPEGRYACYQRTVGLNWERLAGRDSTERDLLVDELLLLLTQVNKLVSGRLISSFQEILDTASAQIEQKFKFDLGTFRLLLFVQFCSHLRVVIEPGKNFREIIYPIKGSVGYQRIVDKVGCPAKVLPEVCRFLQSELSTSSRRVFIDEIETMLCDECEEGHVNELDTFIKGQSLFRLDEDGKPMVKVYGRDSEWTEVPLLKEW